MYKEKTNRLFLALGAALFSLGMAAAAVWDLAIDRALYAPGFFPAVWMECFGYYPLYLPAFFWLACEMAAPGRAGRLRAACAAGQLAGLGILAWKSYENLTSRGMSAGGAAAHTAAVWAAAALGEALLLALMRRRGEGLRLRLCFAFRWATVYLLAETVVINLLKLVWNRTRFDDMLAAGSFAPFTAWTQPFGSGGTSFPSGHTASACGIFALVLLCDVLPGWHRRRALVWCACWAYVAGMAAMRLVIGRHFLSDTLTAAFVMSLLFFALVKSRPYRASRLALENRLEAQRPPISP